jgi:hypothetical protein
MRLAGNYMAQALRTADYERYQTRSAILLGFNPTSEFYGGQLDSLLIQGNQPPDRRDMSGKFISFARNEIGFTKSSHRKVARLNNLARNQSADSLQIVRNEALY